LQTGKDKRAARPSASYMVRQSSSSAVANQQADHPNLYGVRSRVGYELRLSSSIDPQFGPVLRFGMGGHLAEVFRDWALALPPLNTTLARRLMEQTRIFEALKGVRGRRAIDIEALERLLVRFSELVLEQSAIREIDINPLLASPAGLLVLDAQVVLYHKETPTSDIPRPAIRPYPSQYCGRVSLADGTVLNIRPIRPEDEPEVVRFHSTLSQESVFSRYFALIRLEKRIRHERLIRMCFVDYDRQMAMVAQKVNPDGLLDGIVAIARLRKSPLRNEAEVAVVVSDAFHRRGIGTLLIHRLIEIARDERIAVLTASVLADNPSMRTLLEKEGFVFDDSNFSEIVHGAVQL
jgi:acetyltransferase